MSPEAQVWFWIVFVVACVGFVPLLGGAMLRLACHLTGVPGVRFGRCWLAYLAAYVIASVVGVPLLLLLPTEHGVPTALTLVVWLGAALVVHAMVVPRVLGTPVRRTLVAHGIALALTACVILLLALPAGFYFRREVRRVARIQQFVEVRDALQRISETGDGQEDLVPAAIYSADGKPLLSWRVALLPYLERQDLYDQFRLDEPWDSPHNLPLVGRMPRVFGEGDDEFDGAGKTRLRIMVSSPQTHPRTPFIRGARRGVRLSQLSDGSMWTAVVLEMADPTIWTRPDEPEYVPGGPLPVFGNPARDRLVYVLYADGSVRALRADNSPQAWEALITGDGREAEQPN